MSSSEKRISGIAIFALMIVYFFNMGLGTLNPVIGLLSTIFPKVNPVYITYVATIPSIGLIIGSLLCGIFVGTKIKFRSVTILGLLIFTAGGCLPLLSTGSFSLLMVSRLIFGFGLGLVSAVANPLVTRMFSNEMERARWVGVGSFIAYLGAATFNFIAAGLSSISWEMAYWGHAVAFVAAILVFLMLPEPEKIITGNESSDKKEKISLKDITSEAWLMILVVFSSCMLIGPTYLNTSTIVTGYGGTVTGAATILSIGMVGSMISSLCFSFAYKKFGQYLAAIGAVGIAIAFSVIYYSSSLMLFAIGVMMTNFSNSLIITNTMMTMGTSVSPKTVAFASSIAFAAMNVGTFLATGYMALIQKLTGDGIMAPFFYSSILAVILAVLLFIRARTNKN